MHIKLMVFISREQSRTPDIKRKTEPKSAADQRWLEFEINIIGERSS